MKVASLKLDHRNPRLTHDGRFDSQRDILQYLFEHGKAFTVAQSIASRGYFSNEPLLAIKDGTALVVVEGNRRLAALKVLLKPDLLEGSHRAAMEKLALRAAGKGLDSVPVTTAPNRRLTDRYLAGRHTGTSIEAWEAPNRARFILEKIQEGYEPKELHDELGFAPKDIRDARLTDALAKIIRAVDLPDAVRKRLNNPNSKVLSTVERIVKSSVGRKLIMLEPDADHGVRGTTTKDEFEKGFTRLLKDIASGDVTSRSMNTNVDMVKHYKTKMGSDRPKKRPGGFLPEDIIGGRETASRVAAKSAAPALRSKAANKWVVPKSFKVVHGAERLRVIRKELIGLERQRFPNAGAVLLRVFLELSMIDYLERTKRLAPLVEKLRHNRNAVKNGVPIMGELRKVFETIAKEKLKGHAWQGVCKALQKDLTSPFGIDDLHAVIHQLGEFPSDHLIQTFWHRMQPLFSLMLEQDPDLAI